MEKQKRDEEFLAAFNSKSWMAVIEIEEELKKDIERSILREQPGPEKTIEDYGKRILYLKGQYDAIFSLWRRRDEIIKNMKKKEEDDANGTK